MHRPSGHSILVGVTGGIGSGKTLVCRAFERLGVPVLYADDIAKTISVSSPAVRRKIRSLLGGGAYHRDGSFNRPYVARLIFSRPRLQKKLEAIVHPRVRREIFRRASKLSAQGHLIIVVEAALIFESGTARLLDYTIVVDAPRQQRIRRVAKRDGLSHRAVERRMRAQWSTRHKRRLADVVVDNTGSPAELRRAVKHLFKLFTRIAQP